MLSSDTIETATQLAELLEALILRTLGGTPNGDPCSLWGLIWGLHRDIGAI